MRLVYCYTTTTFPSLTISKDGIFIPSTILAQAKEAALAEGF